MRKSIVLILNVFILIIFHAGAQIQNSFLFWGSGGYSTLFTDASGIKTSGGAGLGIGAGYELQIKKFKIHTGVEYVNLNSSFKLDAFTYDITMFDTEDDEYTAHFWFYNNKDSYKLGYINIPVMLGHNSVNFISLPEPE